MRIRKAFTAIAAACALAVFGVVAPASEQPAEAAVAQTTEGVRFNQDQDQKGSLVTAFVMPKNKGRAELTFNNPNPFGYSGLLQTRLDSHLWLAGTEQFAAADATVTVPTKRGNVSSVQLIYENDTVKLIRTYSFDGVNATLDVKLENKTDYNQQMQLDLTHAGIYNMPTMRYSTGANPIKVQTDRPQYDLEVAWTGNPQSTGVSDGGKWAQTSYGAQGEMGYRGDKNGSARVQGGRWFRTLKAGEIFEGAISVKATPPPETVDTDQDGIPDEWERGSFTPEGSEEALDFARWGADPEKRDIFVQLNWMKPEVGKETCSPGGRFARTPRGFTNYVECAEANKNEYRPSKKALNDLVDLFAKEGINLHIDAGDWYNNFSKDPVDWKGGPTIDYRPSYYPNEAAIEKQLEADRINYLGSRQSVFRLGIIGDNLAPGDYSSGVGLTPGGSFYVAKQSTMTSDEQVRNTLLHELGHNLGLGHSGTPSVAENRDKNYLPNYKSTMNYLYQFTHFGFTDEVSRSSPNLPPQCSRRTCYLGEYTVPADWDNLQLVNGSMGRFPGVVNPPVHLHSHKNEPVRDVEIYGGPSNNGKGGFRLVDDQNHRNGIIAFRKDNYLLGEISNHGSDEHEFEVVAKYGDGKTWREKFLVEGLPATPEADPSRPTKGKKLVQIPIEEIEGYTGEEISQMAVTIQVFNQNRRAVYNEELKIPLLAYTEDDMKQVVGKIDDPSIRAIAEDALTRPNQPVYDSTTTTTARNDSSRVSTVATTTQATTTKAPEPTKQSYPEIGRQTTPVTTVQAPAPQGGEPDSKIAIIAGSVVGLLMLIFGVAGAVLMGGGGF